MIDKELEKKYINHLIDAHNNNLTDNENRHLEADYVLLDFIKELGYTKVAEKWEEISDGFWYA